MASAAKCLEVISTSKPSNGLYCSGLYSHMHKPPARTKAPIKRILCGRRHCWSLCRGQEEPPCTRRVPWARCDCRSLAGSGEGAPMGVTEFPPCCAPCCPLHPYKRPRMEGQSAGRTNSLVPITNPTTGGWALRVTSGLLGSQEGCRPTTQVSRVKHSGAGPGGPPRKLYYMSLPIRILMASTYIALCRAKQEGGQWISKGDR